VGSAIADVLLRDADGPRGALDAPLGAVGAARLVGQVGAVGHAVAHAAPHVPPVELVHAARLRPPEAGALLGRPLGQRAAPQPLPEARRYSRPTALPEFVAKVSARRENQVVRLITGGAGRLQSAAHKLVGESVAFGVHELAEGDHVTVQLLDVVVADDVGVGSDVVGQLAAVVELQRAAAAGRRGGGLRRGGRRLGALAVHRRVAVLGVHVQGGGVDGQPREGDARVAGVEHDGLQGAHQVRGHDGARVTGVEAGGEVDYQLFFFNPRKGDGFSIKKRSRIRFRNQKTERQMNAKKLKLKSKKTLTLIQSTRLQPQIF